VGVFTIELQEGDWQVDMFSTDNQNSGVLRPGRCLYSAGQTFRLLFNEADGDLIIQKIDDGSLKHGATPASAQNWIAIWSLRGDLHQGPIATGPGGIAGLVMQYDGNLVTTDVYGDPRWASGTQDNTRAFLRMQDDGNLVIYTVYGGPIWATNTYAGTANRPTAGPL
jgi:hypothetical protein